MAAVDCAQEYLSASDIGAVQTRRLLLDSVAAYGERGKRSLGVDDPDIFMVRLVSLHLPMDKNWADAGEGFIRAELGADLGDAP
jgi:hypothetical protein